MPNKRLENDFLYTFDHSIVDINTSDFYPKAMAIEN